MESTTDQVPPISNVAVVVAPLVPPSNANTKPSLIEMKVTAEESGQLSTGSNVACLAVPTSTKDAAPIADGRDSIGISPESAVENRATENDTMLGDIVKESEMKEVVLNVTRSGPIGEAKSYCATSKENIIVAPTEAAGSPVLATTTNIENNTSNANVTNEVPSATNGGVIIERKSAAGTEVFLDQADAQVIEELGRRYPKRAREQTWGKKAAEKEKKEAAKKKKLDKTVATSKNVPPARPPPDALIGRYVEQSKLLGTTSGQFYPLNGKIVDYRPAEGRIPGRYAIRWEYPTTNCQPAEFILEDEWVMEDLEAFDEAVAKGSAPIMTYSAYKSTSHSHHPPPLKLALENVRQRRQLVVERDLQESQLLSILIVVAALEEALQTSLQLQQQQQEANSAAVSLAPTTTKASSSSTSKPHPPLYYTANPSSYLSPPSADKSGTSSLSNQPKTQMTPTILAQRLRQGSQWAWAYLQSKQPTTQLLESPVGKRTSSVVAPHVANPSDAAAIAEASISDTGTSVAQRRSVRATRMAASSYIEDDGTSTSITKSASPGQEEPNPGQRGGRIAMWWINALEEKANHKAEKDLNISNFHPKIAPSKSEKPVHREKGKSKRTIDHTNTEDAVMTTETFEDDEQDEDTKDDDDDYTGGDGEQDDDDESLEGVERERAQLSPVTEPVSVVEENVGEEENEEDEIMWRNPYLRPSFPALLEYLARPKAITLEEVQKAMDVIILKIRHNKRSMDNGIDVSDLVVSDKVILAYEIPNYPSNGKVVLKCTSGETAGELQRLDANTFGRCKFELEVIGEEEKAIQIQRKEDIHQREIEFKERKTWDRWRFRGIHEGYAVWPSWEDGATAWVKENVTSEASVVPEMSQMVGDTKDDEALAKSLEENEVSSGGRRRTARRAAATATEGVFYGNQSQLTQKQLMDALLRLVKTSLFQTLMKLQSLVADDSSDPIRRCRIALGKMLWKRNVLARKAVTSQLGDRMLTADLASGKRLLELQSSADTNEDQSSGAKDLLDYLSSLHRNELKLRDIILTQLSEIPIPIVATAADERMGSLESLDDSDFEATSIIVWHTSGHPLLQNLIYRPPTQSTIIGESTECAWYKVKDFSKSIKSDEDDAEDVAMERRMRFRVEPTVGPGNEPIHDGKMLILTEAQVHAGAKAAEMQREQETSTSASNPYACVSGDSITLVPIDGDDGNNMTVPEIHGRIVGHDSRTDGEDSTVEYRVMILPDPDDETKIQKEAFWADLDVRADDSSYVCQPEGQNTWYMMENQDYHHDSEAYNECEKVLTWLSSQSKASPFSVPVDPIALGIPSYPQIVKHPMDISTIMDKLENGHYSSIPPGQSYGQSPVCRMLNGPFRKDVELMFDNAIVFNPPDDWIHQAAISLKKGAIKKIETASSSAERAYRYAGGRQKHSIYMDDDSDQDDEYESDQEEDLGGSRRLKRRRDSTGSTNKDEASARTIENSIRLHNCLKEGNDLRGPFSNLPINTDASTFSLPSGWSCRKRIIASTSNEDTPEQDIPTEKGSLPDDERKKQELAREMADLLALHKAMGESETSGLRRSTRAHHPSEGGSSKATSKVDDLEYFDQSAAADDATHQTTLPTSRLDVEVLREMRHEEYYSKLFFQFEKELAPTGKYGMYTNGSFPPYLGHVSPFKNRHSVMWEIRSPLVVPAIRWVIRGLIHSGHLTALEPMTSDITSGVMIKNDIYYWDPTLQPFEVLDVRGLQRRKRADNAEEDESEDDFEMSDYEKARAERVARNAERLRSLGLA
jgi:hypothetical protein